VEPALSVPSAKGRFRTRRSRILPLLLAGSLIAGLYGAIHNQVSYTVSPEFFHKFKFIQFRIPSMFHNRLGASIVGFNASIWTGLAAGLPLVLLGFVHREPRTYTRHVLVAFLIVALSAFCWAVAALWLIDQYGRFLPPGSTILAASTPEGVKDRMAFTNAGMMHNLGYIGGVIGVLGGAVYLGIAKFIAKRRESPRTITTTL
jgi:hypothetical protein